MTSVLPKRLLLALFLPLLLVLTGCMHIDADFTFKDDESVDFTVKLLDPQNRMGDGKEGQNRCDSLIPTSASLTQSGQVVTSTIKEEGVPGCVIEGSNFTLEEVNNLGYGEVELIDNHYQVTTVGLDDLFHESHDFNGTITMSFPGKIVDSAGGNKNSKEDRITWEMPRSAQPVGVQAQATSGTLMEISIWAGIAVLGLGLVTYLWVNDRRKKKTHRNVPDDDSSDNPSSDEAGVEQSLDNEEDQVFGAGEEADDDQVGL